MIKFKFHNFSTTFLPKPSIFIASLEIKCLIFSIAILSQPYPSFVHLLTASYFFVVLLYSLSVLEPHDGHFDGKRKDLEFFNLLLLSTSITWGITSPALSIFTISPTLISFLLISSSLCKVALETTTPPIFTGLTFATGVNAPVLPTWISIFKTLVMVLSAENLCAIAQRGAFDVKPSRFWRSRSFTL